MAVRAAREPAAVETVLYPEVCVERTVRHGAEEEEEEKGGVISVDIA